MERVDITVIGGGPVGLFAAFYAGMRGMSVRVIDSLPELGGQLTALYPEKYVYDMPGFPSVLARELAENLIAQAARFNPDIVLGETACALSSEGDSGYTIQGSSGRQFPTRCLIISAGNGAFSPTKLEAVHAEDFIGRGLSYGVSAKRDYAGLRVAVVGGGDSAFDWAANLHEFAKSIVIVHRRDEFRAHEETVRTVRDLGIELKVWRIVSEVRGNGQVTGVTLKDPRSGDTEELDCDAVVVNIGYKSSLGPLKDWGLEIAKNQIVVDHLFRTRLPGVFAVGDVCQFDGKVRLIATGVGEATTAVCLAKTLIDPTAKLFPGHSSDMSAFAVSS